MKISPLTKTEGQTRRFIEKREVILEAAAGVFNRHGVHAGTLALVASSVGLIANSVTYYYPQKEDLAAACLLRTIEAFDSILQTAQQQSNAEKKVRAFLSGYATLLAHIECGRRAELITFNDIRALPERHQQVVFEAYTNLFRGVRGLLPRGNSLSHTDCNARAHLLLSLTTWMRPWISRYETDDYQRVADRVGDILIDGLAAVPGQWAESPDPEIGWPQPATGENAKPEAFLRAATVLVNEHGYRGVSVERIAAMLNLTKGSFYHHHENKDSLLIACFERSFDVLRQAQRIAAERGGTGWQKITAVARSMVRYQLSEQGPLLRITARSALPQTLREEPLKAKNRLTERLGMFIVEGTLDGSVRPLDQAIAAQQVAGMINAASELKRWVPSVTVENAANLYARPLFVGILCAGHSGGLISPRINLDKRKR